MGVGFDCNGPIKSRIRTGLTEHEKLHECVTMTALLMHQFIHLLTNLNLIIWTGAFKKKCGS